MTSPARAQCRRSRSPQSPNLSAANETSSRIRFLHEPNQLFNIKPTTMTTTRSQSKKQSQPDAHPETNAHSGSKHKPTSPTPPAPEPEAKRPKKAEDAKHEAKSAKTETPEETSPILEKGIIYFFFRARVDTDSPSSVNDIARTFLLLRPVPHSAELEAGPIGDTENTGKTGKARLLAVPKKVLPRTGRDRWIAFVEKAGEGSSFISRLEEEFLSGSEYETKTVGVRHSPAATPVGEGVYAITDTGGTSHLAYILTIPGELGEVQRKMGIQERGSFILSTRNPKFAPPGNARLPKGPEYPNEYVLLFPMMITVELMSGYSILEAFRSRRWMPTQPSHLDFVNTQILLVGESSGLKKALEPPDEDTRQRSESPAEEMEKLEEEDAERMKALSEDDAGRIFADLEVRAKDYPKLQTKF